MNTSPVETIQLPPLRDVIERYGLRAKKSLGQNFLLDLNLTRKIARLSGDLSQAHVLEIGPGPGGLTRGLLMEGAHQVTSIERDERCSHALQEISQYYPNQLNLLFEDALNLNYEALDPSPSHIIANLPYNIGTELLIRWMTPQNWPPPWRVLSLMFQREVAERIVAQPSTKAYGRLAVLIGWRANAQIVLNLPPQAFTPPPKVSSAVVLIRLLDKPRFEADPKRLEAITREAFGQRRKMLRASLKKFDRNIEARLESIGIDPTARAETLSIEAFCTLARHI